MAMLDRTTTEDMRTALFNLQLSPDKEGAGDTTSSDEEREDWEVAVSSDDESDGVSYGFRGPPAAVLRTPPRSPRPSAGAPPLRSPAPSSDCSSFTPAAYSSRSAGAGLPPRSGQATHTGGSGDASASTGKYIPPALKNGAQTPPPSRFTPPCSPQRRGGSGVTSSPYGYLSPQPQSISGSHYHSPQPQKCQYPKPSPGKPPLGLHTPNRPSARQSLSDRLSPHVTPTSVAASQRSALTPNTYITNSASRDVPSSQKSCYSVYRDGENSPGGTPEQLTPNSKAAAEIASKTAVKRAVHDAKATGLTFNQKKHRSPSHLRRSQRRQQERFATGSMPSKVPSSRLDGKENGYVDPWEAENDPCTTQEFASSNSATGHDTTRLQLNFDKSFSSKSLRSLR